MRNRNAVTALLITMIGLLTGALVGLFACDRPQAAGPDPGPGATTPSPDPTRDGGRGAGARVAPTRTGSTKSRPGKTGATSKPPSTPVTRHTDPGPARLGNASVPDYDLSSDGQTFTVRFDSLEASTEGATSKSFTATVPLSGNTANAVVEFGVSGYAFADESSGATLTVTACGRSQRYPFRAGADESFVFPLAAPLRGVRTCVVKLNLEVRGTAAYANVSSLDAQLI